MICRLVRPLHRRLNIEVGAVRFGRAFGSAVLRFKGTLGCLFSRDPNMEADVGFPPSRDDFSARDEEDYEEDDRSQLWLSIWKGVNRYILAGT